MKKNSLFFFILLFCQARLPAQNAPSIEWQKCFGGNSFDDAHSIQQTTDSGFIVAGYSQSDDGDVSGNHGYGDYWIIKLNSSGNIQWEKCLGGSGWDIATSIQQTADSGFIVAGYSSSNSGDVSGNHDSDDCWIVKLNSSGDIQWQKCLGGSNIDEAWCIKQTLDKGFIFAGNSTSNDGDVFGWHEGYDYYGNGYSDYLIVKLDSSGNIQWQKCLGGSNIDEAWCIKQTLDKGFIIAGSSESNDGDVSGNHGSSDAWIVKLDSSANIQWQKSFGGSGDDDAYSIQQINEGGFIVAGYSNSNNNGDVTGNHGNGDYWIVRLNSSGNIEWQKCLGGSNLDETFCIQQTFDGGFVIAGRSDSNDGDVAYNHGGDDYWVEKVDSSGNPQWQKSLGGNNNDLSTFIQQTSDEGFVVAGFSDSNDGDVSNNHGSDDYWIVKLSPEIPLGIPSVAGPELFTVYPNPTNSNIMITATFTTPQSLVIKLTDIVGREVLSFDEGLVSGNFTTHYDLGALSSGTYFLKMIHDGTSGVKKVGIEK